MRNRNVIQGTGGMVPRGWVEQKTDGTPCRSSARLYCMLLAFNQLRLRLVVLCPYFWTGVIGDCLFTTDVCQCVIQDLQGVIRIMGERACA